jgi:hypothetical protein
MTYIEVLASSKRLGAANEVIGETTGSMLLNRRSFYLETFALASPHVEIMLGADWLQPYNCLWFFGNGKLYRQ